MCVSLRSSIKGLGGSEGSVQDLSCCLLGSNLWCWPGICWRNSSSLGVTVSNAPITIRTTLNLTFHICSSCSFSTWHPWLCLLSSAFRSTSRFPVLLSFSSEWLCPGAVIPGRWENTLDGSSENRPSASLVYLFSLVALFVSVLWTSVCHPGPVSHGDLVHLS